MGTQILRPRSTGYTILFYTRTIFNRFFRFTNLFFERHKFWSSEVQLVWTDLKSRKNGPICDPKLNEHRSFFPFHRSALKKKKSPTFFHGTGVDWKNCDIPAPQRSTFKDVLRKINKQTRIRGPFASRKIGRYKSSPVEHILIKLNYSATIQQNSPAVL